MVELLISPYIQKAVLDCSISDAFGIQESPTTFNWEPKLRFAGRNLLVCVKVHFF